MNQTTVTDVTKIKGWEALEEQVRAVVLEEDEKIQKEVQNESRSRMAIGGHLLRIQESLPRGMWNVYSRTRPWFRRSTIYNYLREYQNAQALPKPIYDVAVTSGIHAIDTKKLASVTIPKFGKSESPAQKAKILEFLQRIEKRPGRKVGAAHAGVADPDTLLRQSLHVAGMAFDRLETSPKVRQRWIESFFGMCMTRFGLSSEKTFAPIAIPDHMRVVRGRPPLKKAA